MRNFYMLGLLVLGSLSGFSQKPVTKGPVSGTLYADIAYKSGNKLTDYEKSRCVLDIYTPGQENKGKHPVIVYFYGGGLTSGDKTEGWADWSNNFGFKFLESGVVMVMVNYRLSGQQETKWPAYLQDAAAAVAWVSKNIGTYGGDAENIYVMGFSAGAYLAHMLRADTRWYSEIKFDSKKIRGYIPISGQTRAHGTIANDLGIQKEQIIALRPDAMPFGYTSKTETPMYIFVGEREGQTITDNYDYYNELLKQGSPNVFIYTNPGKDHGGMRDGLGDAANPTRDKILDFMKKYSNNAVSKSGSH